MVIQVKHAKTNAIADWTQPQLDAIIAGGAAPLPPVGTTLAEVTLPSDWNDDHVIVGLDDEYARLDGTNQPFTGALRTFSATPNLTLENTAANATNAGTLIFKSDTESFTQTYDASANTFNMLYGANNVMKVFDTTALSLALGHGCSVSLTGTATKGVAIGQNCTTTLATGTAKGFAIGFDCSATPNSSSGSFAAGLDCSGSGVNIGRQNIGVGYGIGNGNTTTLADTGSVAIGQGNTCSAGGTTSMGNTCVASGFFAQAFGSYCNSTGTVSTAIGYVANANNQYAFAMGLGANATADNAGILGYSPNSFYVANSTSNSLMLAYESTNLLLTGTGITANASFNLRTGTAAANTYPLKFTSGALLTTPVVGVEEFLTDKRYTTITTGTARKEYTLNDIALTSGRVSFSTTNGRQTDSANFTYATNRLSPTYLTLAAGTAAAGTCPLVMTSGALLTTAIAGGIEFLTDKFYGTITTGAARKEFTLNDIALTSGRVPFATTNGRLTDAAAFTFAGSTLTVTNIAATTYTGTQTYADAINLVFNTTTGSKIGTATTQKLGLWNATPIVQPTTAVAAATFVTNTSLIANDSATFDGYTIGQVVKALRNIGILA